MKIKVGFLYPMRLERLDGRNKQDIERFCFSVGEQVKLMDHLKIVYIEEILTTTIATFFDGAAASWYRSLMDGGKALLPHKELLKRLRDRFGAGPQGTMVARAKLVTLQQRGRGANELHDYYRRSMELVEEAGCGDEEAMFHFVQGMDPELRAVVFAAGGDDMDWF